MDKISKFLASLDSKTKIRLKKELELIKENPYKFKNSKKLRGFKIPTFRIRVGQIRIIYTVKQDMVEIIDINYRGNIY